jgi:Fur family zinc uptake transcriptional regulator
MQLNVNQQRVLATLRQGNRPLGAYALLDRLREEGFSARTQIYRALERLAEHGLVHPMETLNAYVSCAYPAGSWHSFKAFTICQNGACL